MQGGVNQMSKSFSMLEVSLINTESNVYEVILNRTEVKNALNGKLIAELYEAIHYLQDKNAKVVIMKGNDGNFAAGADIKEMLNASFEEIGAFTNRIADLQNTMKESPIIFISAIEGYCLGGGLELALATDIKIAHEEAKFGFPEVKLGILPGGGGTQRLLTLTGSSFANHFILTGELFSAQKAYEMKIISEIVPDVTETARTIATTIAQNNRHALIAIKQLISGIENTNLTEGLKLEQQKFQALFSIGEAREGLRAFVEKRKPNFTK